MNKFKQTLSLLLVAVLVLSVVPAAATDGLSNSEWSVTTGEGVIGDDNTVEVTVTKGSNYMITIPKTVVLAGSTGIGSYAVKVEGDLSGTEYITVEPYTTDGLNLLEDNNTFDLNQTGKDSVPAKVTQSKIEWNIANMIDAAGTIAATDDNGNNLLTAGSWSGSFVFNINRNERQTTLEGDGQTYHKMAPSALSFRSNAPIDEFQEVLINGEPLDDGAYTLTEGSTIVTLNIDYLETLDIDNYEITVVSKNGSPSADFGVVTTEMNEHGFYYNQPYTAYVEALGGKFALFVRMDGTADIINVSNGVPDTITYELDGNTVIAHTDDGSLKCIISNDGSEIYCEELGVTFVLGDESIVADEDYIYIYDESLSGYVVYTINRRQSSYHAIKTGINGLPTVKLGDFMFEDNTDLIVPQIPDSVTIFGDYIFSNCSNLTNIEIPDSVITLGGGLFSGCENLKTIKIGSGLRNIEDTSFWGSYHLNKIIVSPDNETYHSSGNCLIETNTKTLILGSNNSTIPMDGSVEIIGRYAFLDCKQMTSIVIPDGVEDMEYGAFNGCTNLKNIYFGKDIKNISETIFYYCPSISDISVSPNNSIYYSTGNCVIKTDANAIILGGNNSVIPTDESINRISMNAFRGRTISHIEIPNNIKYIGSYAFAECENLTSVSVTKNIVYFEDSIFANCSNLTDILFDGTMEQWNAFAKNVWGGNPWNQGIPATEVICSDGIVTLN